MPIFRTVIVSALLILAASASGPLHAELRLGKLFSDHAVLQRDREVRVWGWADPGAPVELCFPGECHEALTDGYGAWEITLPARKAGGPFAIQVTSGDDRIDVKDVYFGDVWLAGGQSNMEWKLSAGVVNVEAEYADAEYPQIRSFEVEKRLAYSEEETLDGGAWVPASRETVPDFSAVAWIFAKGNHLDKNVAVGIIDSNWGGTPAEAWVSRDGIARLPAYRDRVDELLDDPAYLAQALADNEANRKEKYRRLASREVATASGAHRAGFDDSAWKRIDFPSDEPFTDLAWFRRTFALDAVPEGGAILDLGDLVQDAFVFVNGEVVAVENWQVHGSRHHLPASLLREGENLVVLRVGNSWNNRPRVGAMGHMFVDAGSQWIALEKGWTYSNTVEPPLPPERRYEHEPAFLYNGMIHPLRRYGLRGAIWYQGESNVGEAQLYGDLFKGLIADWRRATGQELPFFFVQLAGFLEYRFPQPDSQWAELRHQQESALELPLTGLATAIDIGEEDDIHPRNKQDVGRRLWLQARKVAFGDDVIADGPRVVAHRVEEGRVILTFGEAQGPLKPVGGDSPVEAFILAGEDGVFHAAQARLDGNRVTVWSDQVPNPASLRYAWSDFPRVKLYGESGLPVLPFRIDGLQH